jgi:hypothetical protein
MMPATITSEYELPKRLSVFDSCVDDWAVSTSCYKQVIESRKSYHNPVSYELKLGIATKENIEESVVLCENFILAKGKIELLVNDYADDYDEDFLLPNRRSTLKIEELLKRIFSVFEDNLPVPSLSADGQGGIEATWRAENRYLQIIVPYDVKKAPYLFYKNEGDFAIESFTKNYELIQRVAWLLQTDIP